MAINYAQKYSSVVDERFKNGPMTANLNNPNYDWLGVEAVKVYSVGTSALNDYLISGSNRYGTPSELENEVQTMTLTQDKSFTYTIDKKSEQDTVGVMEVGASLRREIDEVITPHIDEYKINKLVALAGKYLVQVITKTNAMESFLAAQEVLDNKKVPQAGRICYAKPSFINNLKLDDEFTKACDVAQERLINGNQAGEADGVPIIKLPASYFPANVDFVLCIPSAMVAPVKLVEFKVHEDAPGISGALVEGRVRFDAFVLNNKKDAIVVSATKTLSSIAVTTAPTKITYAAGDEFDPTGMVVTATYGDSSTAAVTGYTCSALPSATGNVTITYVENGVTKTATQAVTIS